MNNDIQYYPLTPAQDSLFMSQKYSLTLKKTLNTIGTSFFIDREYDVELLKKAICIGYEKQEALRMRLVKVNKKTVQYIAKYTEPVIGELDFRGKTAEDQEKKLHKLTADNISKLNSDMSKIYIVHTYDNYHGIYMAVSHICMDSTAIFNFYTYVYDVYLSLKNNSPMPKEPASYIEELEKELDYTGSNADKTDVEFWENFYRSRPEPYYASPKGNELLEKQRKKLKDPDYHTATTFTLNSKADHQFCVMPKDLVNKCEVYCRKHSISMQSLLYAAQMTFNTAMSGYDNVCIMSTCSRRAKLTEKTCGGSRIHFNQYFKCIDASENFIQATKDIHSELLSVFKHSNTASFPNMNRLFEIHGKKMITSYHSIGITYQPIRVSIPENPKVQMKWYSNGEAAQPLYMTVMDGNCTGDLHFYYEYQFARFSSDEIIRSHNGIMKIIETAINDETLTAGQLREIVK